MEEPALDLEPLLCKIQTLKLASEASYIFIFLDVNVRMEDLVLRAKKTPRHAQLEGTSAPKAPNVP